MIHARLLRASLVALGTISISGLAAAAAVATPASPVTFTKDIAPLLQAKCQDCHRPGQMAPMSLISYQDVRPWARSIKARVLARTMPPWFIDKTVGIQHFANDVSLTDQQIAMIAKWVDAGAPEGNPKDMPPPRSFKNGNGWVLAEKYGQPDLVLKSEAYTMPAHGQDVWFRPTTPVPITETRWVRAVEMRPGSLAGRRIFHHVLANLYQQETNPDGTVDTSDGNASLSSAGLLMEWAIGKNYDIYRPNTGKLLLPGSQIRWEMHMHAVGEQKSAITRNSPFIFIRRVWCRSIALA